MGTLRDIVSSLLRRLSNGDNSTPHTSSSGTEFPSVAITNVRRDEVVIVWQVGVLANTFVSALVQLVVPYPSGVDQCSDELPGMDGDKPDVTCEIGGLPANVVRMLRGETHLGFDIELPNGVDLADHRGQIVSLVWSGVPGYNNSLVFRLRAKKV